VTGTGNDVQLHLWQHLGHVPGYRCKFCIKLACNEQDGYMQSW